jgi:micrococcal nuclease
LTLQAENSSMRKPVRGLRSVLIAWLPVLAIVCGAGGASLFLGPQSNGAEQPSRAATFTLCAKKMQANCVIDGDTIRYGGEKVRIMDIDAPEIHEPKCASEKALGDRATLRLLEIINAGPITLVRVGHRDRDQYGRHLRTIQRNGRSITEVMVAEGLARKWDGRRRSWC